jgi:hypothetical protein
VFAACVTAHPVRDDEETEIEVDEERVLVVVAPHPDVTDAVRRDLEGPAIRHGGAA